MIFRTKIQMKDFKQNTFQFFLLKKELIRLFLDRETHLLFKKPLRGLSSSFFLVLPTLDSIGIFHFSASLNKFLWLHLSRHPSHLGYNLMVAFAYSVDPKQQQILGTRRKLVPQFVVPNFTVFPP